MCYTKCFIELLVDRFPFFLMMVFIVAPIIDMYYRIKGIDYVYQWQEWIFLWMYIWYIHYICIYDVTVVVDQILNSVSSDVSYVPWYGVTCMIHIIIVPISLLTNCCVTPFPHLYQRRTITRHKATMSYGLKYWYRRTMTGGAPRGDTSVLNNKDGRWLFHIHMDV